ncbi:unnamed protein product [Linum trigynum]|uniref:Uncharacterized protein n=1 Tax=Linum trigynum TaxID=586398 RepID=A0AAV2FCU3_9ROSI
MASSAGDPLKCGECIVLGRGDWILRCEAVIDGGEDDVGLGDDAVEGKVILSGGGGGGKESVAVVVDYEGELLPACFRVVVGCGKENMKEAAARV